MSEEDVSLYDLLNLSIGTPQKGAVNFSALHVLLHAVLRQLNIREMKTRWRDAPPGGEHTDALVGVTEQDHHTEEGGYQTQKGTVEQEDQPETELEDRTAASSSGADSQWTLQSRIQTCEDKVSKVLKLIEELHEQKQNQMEELKELRHQQQMVSAQPEMVSALEKCCHRVDVLEDTVRSLSDTFQKYPEPEELSRCVTSAQVQSPLLSERENLQGMVSAQPEMVSALEKCCHRVDVLEDTVRSLSDTFQKYPEPEELSRCVTSAQVQSPLLSERENLQGMVSAQPEMVSALEKCCHRVDVLEDTVRSLSDTFQKYPEPEELSRCVTSAQVQSALLSERENLQGPAAPSSPSTAGQITTLCDETDSGAATEMPSGLTGPLQRTEAGQEAAGMPLSGEAGRRSEHYPEVAEALRNIGKLRDMFGKQEARVAALEEGKVDQSQLAHIRELFTKTGSHDASNIPMNQLTQQRALIESLMSDREKNVQLVNDLQTMILQLQAECEKLHESTMCLHEDSRQKQSHIQELYKMTEELEEKKADKQMVESEIKRADKSALESKVSRLQFDSVTEQLNTMFQELLDRVTGQEQDWHKVIDKLSAEMDCKLNRIELDSVKKQLEGRWKNINKKLKAQEAPEHDDAAVFRTQLLDRFHCLSCDRPIVKYASGQFPSNKSTTPSAVDALEQYRQHSRSERISGLADYSHMTVSRTCGGSHTVNSASQRRQAMKQNTHTEVDLIIQAEEVGVVGQDGHVYKGRVNTMAVRKTESKLPTISAKDGVCKTKDKAKPTRPAAPLEAGYSAPLHHPHSAKSAQCSDSATSSEHDYPVSALGCTSRSSFSLPSGAAESNTEPLDL